MRDAVADDGIDRDDVVEEAPLLGSDRAVMTLERKLVLLLAADSHVFAISSQCSPMLFPVVRFAIRGT